MCPVPQCNGLYFTYDFLPHPPYTTWKTVRRQSSVHVEHSFGIAIYGGTISALSIQSRRLKLGNLRVFQLIKCSKLHASVQHAGKLLEFWTVHYTQSLRASTKLPHWRTTQPTLLIVQRNILKHGPYFIYHLSSIAIDARTPAYGVLSFYRNSHRWFTLLLVIICLLLVLMCEYRGYICRSGANEQNFTWGWRKSPVS
jgi:hypothetical protein